MFAMALLTRMNLLHCASMAYRKAARFLEDICDKNENLTIFVADMYLHGLGWQFPGTN